MPSRPLLTSLEDRSVPASFFDFNYGTDGLASLPGLSAAAIHLLPDGSAYVAGSYRLSGDDTDFGVFKLTPAGRPDPTFGSNGLVTIPFDLAGPTTGDDIPTTVDVVPDGRVMVVGTAAGANFSQVAVARLLPSGMLDPSFDADGKLAFALDPTATAFETLLAAGIRPDGSLVAAGRSGRAAVAVRLNPDGGRDTGYGQVALGDDAAAAAVDTDGRVLVAHLAATLVSPVEQRNDLSVSRVDASGRLDATYGGDGRAEAGSLTFQPDRRSFAVADVAALAGGRALASVTRVSTVGNSDREAVVTRLDAAGSPDPGFASTTELDLSRVREDAAGRLIGGPYVEPSGPVVLRRTPDGQPDPGFGRGGLVDLSLIGVTSADRVPRAPLPDGTVLVAAVVGGEGYKVVRVLPTANELPTLTAPASGATRAGEPVSFIVTVADLDQAADALTVTAATNTDSLFPPGGVAVSGSGATRTVTLTPVPGQSGGADVTVTVRDRFGATASAVVGVTVAPFPAALGGVTRFAAGPGAGGGPTVGLFNPDGTAVRTLSVLQPGFTGGVRVASADLTGDGVADLVVGTGPGSATRVEVYDGVTFARLFAADPFEPSFTGGVYVAAGDLTGDGRAELVVSPDEGGGPRVKVYDGASFALLADFFGIEDVGFRGGARTAVGDVDGDGGGDLLVAAGFGGGPRVAGFSGASVAANRPARLFADLFVFEQTLRNGVYLTAGDLDGDGAAEVVAGGGPGGGPRVLALSGRQLVARKQATVADFFAGDQSDRTGVRVAAKDLDGDSRADVVTGVGRQAAAYLGKSQARAFAIDPLPDSVGGVFVG